jgi:hypothetical protein
VSVDLCKDTLVEWVEPGDQLDFAQDEYGYNDDADASYATVDRKTDWWSGEDGDPWVTLYTSQGIFDMPADHTVKRKVQE